MTIIDAVNNFGDNSQEGASAGPMALAVIALLAVATVLLWRNMTARIKRLPASFADQSVRPADAGKPAGRPGAAHSAPESTTVENPAEPGTSATS